MKKSELKKIIKEIILQEENLQVSEKDREITIANEEWTDTAEDLFNKMGYRFTSTFSPRSGGLTVFKFRLDPEFKNGIALLRKKLGVHENLEEDMKLDVDDFTATLLPDNRTLWIVPKSGKRINPKEMVSQLKPLGVKSVDPAEMDSIKITFKSPVNFWKVRQAIWGK